MTNDIDSTALFDPSVGGFQELDGRRVFVRRLGSGGPAVVFLPGAGAVGLDFFVIQREVSRFGTAVVYDRGGTGRSDPVPLPRTAASVATELHALLHAQGLAAPYVLVAHSLGGAYAHRFTQLYPRAVAGLVWVDGFHRDWADVMPAAAIPAAERGNVAALADELRAGPDLPDVPLVALTADGVDPGSEASVPEPTLHAIREGMRKMAAAIVSRMSFGEHRVVANVGHHRLCSTRPDIVVKAIRDVLQRAA